MSLGEAFGGALGGLGQGLVAHGQALRDEARQKREDERRKAERAENRQWQIEDRQSANSEWDRRTGIGLANDAARRNDKSTADGKVIGAIYGSDPRFQAKPGTLGDLLLKTESGGGFDTLFGHSQKDGGRFAGVKVSEMTLAELNEFTDVQGEYGQWVKGKVGRVATPMGAGQIVGTTLRSTAKAMGLSPDTKFTPEVQMQMVDYLAGQALNGPKTQAGKRKALRGVWEGFGSVSDAELDAAIASYESGDIGVTFGDPNADLIEGASNADTTSGVRALALDELEKRIGRKTGEKLTGKQAIERDGKVVLAGQNKKGVWVPYTDDKGGMIEVPDPNAAKNKKPRELSSSLSARIDDWAVENSVDDKVARKFKLKAEELIQSGMSETKAWDTTLDMAIKSDDVVTKKEGWFGKESVTEGTFSGEFRDPDAKGLGPAPRSEAQETPSPPKDPSGGGLPKPQSKADLDKLPSGTRFIDPEGNIRVKT